MSTIAQIGKDDKSGVAEIESAEKQITDNSCPLCSSNRCSDIYTDPHVSRCPDCGHAFRQNKDIEVISGYAGKVRMPEIIVAKYFAQYYYRLLDKHIGFGRINSVLEIGSGDGVLLAYIRSKNPRTKITAIEPSHYHCEHLQRIPNIDVINDYIENAPLDNRYDLVIMSHVLEHIPDPEATLKVISQRFLNPDGYLLIGVPSGEFELFNQQTAALAPAGHLHFFSGSSLDNLLKSSGFKVDSAQGFKIKTIPANYHEIANRIARYSGSKTPFDIFRKYYYKALRRFLTFFKVLVLFLFGAEPDRQPLDSPDGRYNNILLIIQK